jgi:cyclophilin family peptidyl-prolyl cis-trans isomerase
MRPLIGIALLVLAAIGLAVFSSHLHPGGDLPPNEIQAQKDQSELSAKKVKEDALKASVDHSSGAFDKVKAGALHATLVFNGKAPIQIELYPAAAPKTVAQISGLIKKGFYNGIKVHRLEIGTAGPNGEPGLSLFQFGDPASAASEPANFEADKIGTHGSGASVPLEVKLPHVKYSIGMARGQLEDSGDSQIYVNTEDNSSLDGGYCIFGRVVGGQDVLPTIKVGDVIKSFTLQ